MLAARILAAGSALALAGLASHRPTGTGAGTLHAGWPDVVLLGLVAGAVVGAAVMAYRAWSDARYGPGDTSEDPPPLVFPALSQAGGPVGPHVATAANRRPAGQGQGSAGPAAGGTAAPARPRPGAGSAGAPRPAAGSAGASQAPPQAARGPAPPRKAAPAPARRAAPPRGNGAVEDVAEEPVGDATLQLLPGRLEVVSGDAGMEEIRFIRSGSGDSVITLGRGTGSPPTHVQLRSAAVSRRHARLRFHGGSWYVSNLSRTNPAVVNGEVLGDGEAERPLRDGDQLELGDVVLRYRS
jgi:hypothetical protein